LSLFVSLQTVSHFDSKYVGELIEFEIVEECETETEDFIIQSKPSLMSCMKKISFTGEGVKHQKVYVEPIFPPPKRA
tara:strand:- start:5997 stop:6227 length:231 start_codon:yes stop_codon:yes gene_type:complete